MIRAGKMRHRVVIERQSTTLDSIGGLPDTWTEIAEVPAAVEPLEGRELERAQAIVAEASHRFTLRYRDDLALTPKDRLIFNSRTFEIVRVENVRERNVELSVIAIERF